MSQKGSTNAQANTASHPPTNSPTSKYAGNKEFNQWWEHWMSKIPNSPLSAGMVRTPNNASYPTELDETMRKKDAA
jgi:hypothetical protein